MKSQLVLHVVAKLLIPYIILYALYVQFHGEYSPGGGFQAGVIFAAGVVLYSFVFGFSNATRVVTFQSLTIIASLGVLLYALTGVAAMLMGGTFLHYTAFDPANPQSAQQWGIMTIELGVGMTVFSVMLMLFYLFADRKDEK